MTTKVTILPWHPRHLSSLSIIFAKKNHTTGIDILK